MDAVALLVADHNRLRGLFEDKIDLTTDALQARATDQNTPGRSTMGHDELAATVAPV